MVKEYSLKVFVFILWAAIFFVLSLFFTNKVSAQACSFSGYSPPVPPDPALCTPYFSGIDERSSNPPCNPSLSCDNKEYGKTDCLRIGIGGVDATTCCTEGLGRDFCDQKDLGPEIILRYQFRCCDRPTPTPTPIPGRSAEQQQCNSAGTAWFTVATNVCVAASSCTNACQAAGGTCIPSYPCNPGSEPSALSCGGSGVCCQVPAPTATPTPTPTPPCSATNCESCIIGATCGWNGGSCENRPSQNSCPAGYSQWYWTSCSENVCAPTPTLTPTPTPKVTIQGRNVDINGNTLTQNIGQQITINGPVSNSSSSIGSWNFTNVPGGTYSVSANVPSGYSVSTSYSGKNTSPPTASYVSGNSVSVSLTNNGDWADIYFKYDQCVVTTSPSVHNLTVGKTGAITATVTGIPAGKTVSQMIFGSYNTSVATVNPISDSNPAAGASPNYETTVTAVAAGNTAVWATVQLSDGDTVTCQSTGGTDTDVFVTAPTPTPTPTLTPTPTPTPSCSNYSTCDTCIVGAPFTCGWNGGSCESKPDQFTCPAGYSQWYYTSCPPTPDSNVCAPTPTPTLPPPPPSYSISGKIFNDANGDEKSNGDSNYTGAVTISRSPALGSFSNAGGNYSFTDLPAGQYTITFSGLPSGFVFTYPPSSLIVQVGPGCSIPVTSEASCSGNSIINLNAGVTNTADAWFQSTGSDMRWDSGFSNTLPEDKYASILGSGGMPGIIFSGTTTPSFGAGSASQTNWKVSGNASDTRDVFTDTHSLIPTSYRFLLETVDSSAIAKKGVRDLCSGAPDSTNCTLTANLSNGVYKIDGNLNLNGSGYTFPANKDFVILINGNLNINEKILVPSGTTVMFSASGNITVNRAIGEPASSTTPTIEGLYSADTNFVADGNNNCSLATDLRLNVAGSVIANAGRGGGTFVNNRDMCAGNSNFPSVAFIERPDFMLNYPSLVTQTTRAWQEVAP